MTMKSLATDSPAVSAPEPALSEGMTRLLPLVESYGLFNFFKTESCRALSMRGAALWEAWRGEVGVWTVSTLWVRDRAVPGSDRAGLAMFSGEWRIFRGWNPVRVPPRAQCFRRSGAFECFLVCTLCTLQPLI
ncbi:hypothetical protein BJQ89_03369 [Arthrobacter sp. ES1]|nr:hypothetical protein [Arthrobacter sp. ES1]